MIGARVYDGLLTILEYNASDSNTLRSTDIRFDDLNVIDLTFLHGYSEFVLLFGEKQLAVLFRKAYHSVYSSGVDGEEPSLTFCAYHTRLRVSTGSVDAGEYSRGILLNR